MFGPWFHVSRPDPTAAWQPLTDLFDPDRLVAPIEHARLALAHRAVPQVEPRVAASVFSVGLFARILSPVVAAVALDAPGPVVRADDWSWRLEGGSIEFAVGARARDVDLGVAVDELCLPVAQAIGTGWQVSPHLMTGNVASALAGAATVIGRHRPDLADHTRAAVRRVIDARLAGSGRFTPAFVRDSCCLYYRASPGSYCGDCILLAR